MGWMTRTRWYDFMMLPFGMLAAFLWVGAIWVKGQFQRRSRG